ncbi:MAG TPA: hypothetical protein DCP28_25740 [Cytophagales bacterium]|nr:hypothetical protein [Cytophagales bacterium]
MIGSIIFSCQKEEVLADQENLFEGVIGGTWEPVVLGIFNTENGSINRHTIIQLGLMRIESDLTSMHLQGRFPKEVNISYSLTINTKNLILSNANLVTGPSVKSRKQNRQADDFLYFACGPAAYRVVHCPDIQCITKELEFSVAGCGAGSVDIINIGGAGYRLCFFDVC